MELTTGVATVDSVMTGVPVAAVAAAGSGGGEQLDVADKIAQGAEGVVYKVSFCGRPAVVKERFPKKYRHPDLDAKLTKRRLGQEARCLARCSRLGVFAPTVYFVDSSRFRLYLEYLSPSLTLREWLFALSPPSGQADGGAMSAVASELGAAIARMHNGDVVHGDLTTSNVLVCTDGGGGRRVALVDFGLGAVSGSEEDQAVDLYVLERAVAATHACVAEEVNAVVLGKYFEDARCGAGVKRRLADVRARGRKRVMLG